MLSLLFVIFMMVVLFKVTGFFLGIAGRVLGGILGMIGYMILGVLAVTVLGLTFFSLPLILALGTVGIAGRIAKT